MQCKKYKQYIGICTTCAKITPLIPPKQYKQATNSWGKVVIWQQTLCIPKQYYSYIVQVYFSQQGDHQSLSSQLTTLSLCESGKCEVTSSVRGTIYGVLHGCYQMRKITKEVFEVKQIMIAMNFGETNILSTMKVHYLLLVLLSAIILP